MVVSSARLYGNFANAYSEEGCPFNKADIAEQMVHKNHRSYIELR